MCLSEGRENEIYFLCYRDFTANVPVEQAAGSLEFLEVFIYPNKVPEWKLKCLHKEEGSSLPSVNKQHIQGRKQTMC